MKRLHVEIIAHKTRTKWSGGKTMKMALCLRGVKKNDVTSAGDICFCFQLTKMVIMTMIILWTATKELCGK
jgi:hypothetical protein